MKKLLSVVKDIAFILVILFICLLIFSLSQGRHISFAGYRVLRVLTSSMEPTIPGNTCIIVKETEIGELEIGDIIIFVSEDPDIEGFYNTHRIHEIQEENGEKIFITKGDNNPGTDIYPVHEDQVEGIYVGELPGGQLIGRAFAALSDNRVYFLVIMLPLTICLLSYIWQMIRIFTGRDKEEADE